MFLWWVMLGVFSPGLSEYSDNCWHHWHQPMAGVSYGSLYALSLQECVCVRLHVRHRERERERE